MSSFDKVVKLACKPKPAPPKAKYLDPIIAATWSEDGAVHDVCKALVPRLREPNAIVVFKALIVLHTMIRNGATDNVLSHLSSSEVLRLRNVSAGNWEGYNAPQNMQHYALYLDSRIRAYRELKHDAIQVQAETNRDMRLNNSIEEDMAYTTAPPSKASSTKSRAPQRSKTISGRKLRVMTVEKGLLRETKTVQKMIDSLVECRFYLDDLEDELTITALRMLVKDLLILFQAGNEGVINVLEHYFEMSKYDAEDALGIYRNFCGQTERVVEYLGVARKLQNLLNVPIPNLKHAPVSLASSLQEYLDDPNFEQHRLEYKASKATTDTNPKEPNGTSSIPISADTPESSTTVDTLTKSPSPGVDTKPVANHSVADFFTSIEGEQGNAAIVNSTGNQFQQQAAHNPFIQRHMTGALPSHPFGGQVQIQPTGFPSSIQFQQLPPFQANSIAIQPQQPPQHRPFSTFIPQQATGLQTGPMAGFIQPQFTGANPFRQSVFVPQATGMPTFNSNGMPPVPPLQIDHPFQTTSSLQPQFPGPHGPGRQPLLPNTQSGQLNSLTEVPARPASTPLTNVVANPSSASPPIAQPVKSHQTGSRNPFGVPVAPAPPVPKPPTLLELSTGFGRLGIDGNQFMPQPYPSTATGPQVQSNTSAIAESTFSSVASSFAFANKREESSFSSGSGLHQVAQPPNSQMPPTTASFGFPDSFSAPTNATASSQPPTISPIKTHVTGFGGVKPFKPTSSFGASLLESLPPIPQSGTTTPDQNAQTTNHSSTPSLPTNLVLHGSMNTAGVGEDSNAQGPVNSQPTGVSAFSQRTNGGFGPGVGLRPQATGALGGANPFRATMFTTTSSPPPLNGLSNTLASTSPMGGMINGAGAMHPFGPGFTTFGPSMTHFGQDNSPAMQQQNAGASLI